jgi:hypothetical protein
MAGLGNQMFQYATARALALHRNTDVYLDITSYSNMADVDTPRSYELDVYNIKAHIASAEQLSSVLPADARRTKYVDKLKEAAGRGSIWTYLEKHHGYNLELFATPKNVYISGWWQCPKYFQDIRSHLLREFEPINAPNKKNAEYIKKAVSCNSISLHVRRGDYVSNKNASSHHGLAPIEYYTYAIEYFKKTIDSPVFFIFSDDLDWCKNNLPLPEGSIYVDGNEGTSAYEDIRIMKNCKHAVIANSSFSWWGAWLNSNPSKVVVAPKAWLQNEEANAQIDIIPEEWLRF